MIKRSWLLLWVFLGILNFIPSEGSQAQTSRPVVLVIKASGAITPAISEYLQRGIRTAEQQGAEALVFQFNTPGGNIELMNAMVQVIRNSSVPVIVYVAPRGAIAGSAGTVITMAGHLAVMAPETAIGAASPVGGQGEDIESTLESKLKEAIKATLRSLMENRPPEAVALAEETIDNARAVTGNEALEAGMIDFVAGDLTELLQQVDGVTVKTIAGEFTLHTAEATVTELPPSLIEQILDMLTNPNVVFVLLSLGVQAILIELGSPGGWVAGFIGVVCLTLSAYGLGILAVNWLGLIFLITAFVLFILDIKAPTHGALTVAGIGSFIVGALVLFNSPGTPQFQRVSVPLVIASGLFMGGTFAVILTFALRAQRRPVLIGNESIIGRSGKVVNELAPVGIIQLGGEQWTAEAVPGGDPIPPGAHVQVVEVRGIRLLVQKVED